MSHLTKEIKEKIARKAAEATFKPKEEKLAIREHKLAIECYNHVFPKKIRDAIVDVPKGWLRTCDCLKFNAGGWQVTLAAGKHMPTPADNYCNILGNVDGELAKKVQDFAQEKKDLSDVWRAAVLKLTGYLDQFRTFKKLQEAWPEGKEFYAEYNADRPAANVPAVVTKEINAMLGLKDKAA